MPNLRRVGGEAEDRAAEFLIEEGYTIVTRRHKTHHGELDLVALDGDVLVFVEVKYRRSSEVIPELAIDDAKVAHLAEAALEYCVQMNEMDRQTRFDVIAVTPDGIRHHPGAFRPR